MDDQTIEGTLRNAKGNVQDAVGSITGDQATRVRGKANQAAGQAQMALGDAIDSITDFAVEQPGTALVAALGVGVFLGFALARR